MATEQQGCN